MRTRQKNSERAAALGIGSKLAHDFIGKVPGQEDEYVGLEESGDGVWSVHFANVLLGKFSERDFRICS